MSNIQSLRGMKDILHKESELFTYFIQNASRIAKNYGFSYIQTPLLEETALFKRSVGESSDIVNKEMYQFIDKGQNDVCLRPEGTAGVVRSFVQNKFDRAGGVYKFFYYGSMFRYERPQKGRLRQFHQFGCESFGENSVYEDANIICMVKDIFEFFGISFKLLINSLGCEACMPSYKASLVTHLCNFRSELCKDCDNRVETNPIRVLDCKNETCKTLLATAPKITENLCSSCNNNFEKLKEILTANSVAFEVDSNLVRGLDYYTQTAFEFVSCEIGSQNAIAGGGRYDKLVEFLGGRPTPAIGFAIGIERVWELIKIKKSKKQHYYFAALDEKALLTIFQLALKKREDEKCSVQYQARSLNKHFKIAEKLNATHIVIMGEDELKNSTIIVRNLQTKEEKTFLIEEF